MSLPDLTGLGESELRDLMDMVAARLTQMQGEQQNTRQALLDRDVVATQIADLQVEAAALHDVAAALTPPEDGGAPDPLAVLARASCRTVSNTIRLLRVAAGVLDSADIGERGAA